jgi:hypothetical protein
MTKSNAKKIITEKYTTISTLSSLPRQSINVQKKYKKIDIINETSRNTKKYKEILFLDYFSSKSTSSITSF